jgi:hypothetical protein
MHKTMICAALAVATLSSAGCASSSYDDGRSYGARSSNCFAGERSYDCRERLSYEGRHHRHYSWRNDRYESDDGADTAVAGAIIGFALGAAIAGSNSDRDYWNTHRNDRDWRTRCSTAHDGFDGATGTYVGADGYRHYCTQ